MKSRALKSKQQYGIFFLLIIFDIIATNGSYFLSLFVRFELSWSGIAQPYLKAFLLTIPFYTAAVIIVFMLMRLYSSVWKYAGYGEMIRCLVASLITSGIHCTIVTIIYFRMPWSYYIVGTIFQLILVIGSRFFYRIFTSVAAPTSSKGKRILVVGAGAAGALLIHDLKREAASVGVPVCILDDDSTKIGRYIEDVPVVGNIDSLPDAVKNYNVEQIFIAIPTAPAMRKKEIIDLAAEAKCEIKTIPGILQLASGQVSVKSMRDVDVEDLLGRDPVKLDLAPVESFVSGRTVMVTGAGGSIGSELSRQIAGFGPEKLIIFDIYENSLYDLELDLKKAFPNVPILALIGSVRDSRRIMDVFMTHRPQVVYHAAAHKHVPLMEDSPCEAIKNNAIGTYKTAYAALCSGCERFVLISTDKAVNPTNIMGASKRLCEMIVQSFARAIQDGDLSVLPRLSFGEADGIVPNLATGAGGNPVGLATNGTKTRFEAVRFGNVLASNGSVIPLFRKQIASGGPVTVTDPEIIRYFMTIPEAVSLVLLASTYGEGGEVFVLDMGSPVKIDDLARNLIKFSGFTPDVDIKIEYTGLRPGEKLYEEKLMDEEGLSRTENDLIHIGKPLDFDMEEFFSGLKLLMDACRDQDRERAKELTMEITGTYKPQ